MPRPSILIIIVIAQFAGVSLWFAANAVMQDIAGNISIGWLTSMVQLGFIAGTFSFAFLSIADRHSPSKVFFISTLLGAFFNVLILWVSHDILLLYASRLATGFFIAGIYPVGMKISADYFEKDISKALGFLLGALVLGTAFPHLLRSGIIQLDWQQVVLSTSIAAVLGGVLVLLFIPDGPYRKRNTAFNPRILFSMFKHIQLRRAAFGYFGHMWELYAFWAFLPFAVAYFSKMEMSGEELKSVLSDSFFIIAVGSIACILGGYVALKSGSVRVALFALMASGICCLLSPVMMKAPLSLAMCFFLFWGMTVIMDSPQFSSLVSKYAPVENRGTALTFINCIGFSITIFSIQLLDILSLHMDVRWIFLFLFPGPLFGVIALWPLLTEKAESKNSIP